MVTTINADNTTTTNTIVLAIGVDGSLLYKSEPMVDTDESAITVAQEAAASAVASNTTVAAALAVTGFDGTLAFAFAGSALVLLLAGLGLTLRRRRTSPRGR
jgi:opacity protein-like surface antigen